LDDCVECQLDQTVRTTINDYESLIFRSMLTFVVERMLDPIVLEARKAADKEQEFSKVRQSLVDLIALADLQTVFDDEGCDEAKRVYTQAPTLTLLILQRLGGGQTSEIVFGYSGERYHQGTYETSCNSST